MYNWVTLLYSRDRHNIVHQLDCNKKNFFWKKKDKDTEAWGGFRAWDMFLPASRKEANSYAVNCSLEAESKTQLKTIKKIRTPIPQGRGAVFCQPTVRWEEDPSLGWEFSTSHTWTPSMWGVATGLLTHRSCQINKRVPFKKKIHG